MSKIYPGVERRFTPWKNGGGETAEILCKPEGSGFDNFDWRISTAKVGQSGPFSTFPGINRVLTVIEGGAMRLTFSDGQIIDCQPDGVPHCFSGETPCVAELRGAELLDLNLMVRAPLTGAVYQSGAHVPGDALLACYLFALDDMPCFGLNRHDLRELPLASVTVPDNALVLTIRRGNG
ncbi:HutD family protein [Salipiger sp. 1_MG-2023]|uniref:HutD/Ves family protein n=1 Tax=Salipiger sp. 1_MG-2023 TaxID=3062665 RepID=UPI0026E3DFA4|nr:HutD family protein [Salipiger sp. 1_MG-2023]MDO6585159.1 HutD family protein [Salipiger sp. 1_MG-2023]